MDQVAFEGPRKQQFSFCRGNGAKCIVLRLFLSLQDYFHELICITEREKFVVPIRAIGARAILDFPDQVNFSACPVKYSTQKTLLVRNVGNRVARYCISTQSPFSVDRSAGTLGIGDAVQVTVDFHPQKTGDYSRPLTVHYDTAVKSCSSEMMPKLLALSAAD
ncbi:hydrocephalus-inducing protein homolog, partial [Falco naumanni]|uniref:hydrocephalus-inducing protein homolog n=1 Tax=Falco naumanni TaxID=148594 RepID=UPI001ADE89C6